MPAIFTQENKDELYRGMIDAGWEQLVERGVRSLRVEQVARAVGIAKGTFYSFFPSKGDFVYAMLMENRQRAVDELEAERVRAGGRAGRDEVRAWMRRMWRAERNIFRIATADEYDYLVRSFPGDRSFEPATDSRLVRWLIDDAADARPGADAHRVMNLQVALALVLLNRGYMQADALEATVDALIESTLDELFG